MSILQNMSEKELRTSLDEVDEERKLLVKRIRRDGVREGDAAEMNAMNEWAEKVFAEIIRRRLRDHGKHSE
jgi:hypothetical protein